MYGMVLIVMMSGRDYLPSSVPGCGPKIAAEVSSLFLVILTNGL